MGVMPTLDALRLAQERGYDLVEVAPTASPPVTRLLDYGQYKYELAKREKEAKRKSRSVEFKEIRLAQEQKVPYMLVLGDREVEARAAAPRTRAGEQQPAEGWEALAERLAAETAARRPD